MTVFKGTSSVIQNDIIQYITTVIFEQIKSKLSDCMYVAILLDKTPNVSCFSQAFSVVRMLLNVARFVNTL